MRKDTVMNNYFNRNVFHKKRIMTQRNGVVILHSIQKRRKRKKKERKKGRKKERKKEREKDRKKERK